jgi:hypothetical protein
LGAGSIVMPITGSADVEVSFIHTTFHDEAGTYGVAYAPTGDIVFGASLLDDVSGPACGGPGTFSSLGGNATDATVPSRASCGLTSALSYTPLWIGPLTYLGLTRAHDLGPSHPAVEGGICLDPVDQRGFPRPVGLECEPGSVERSP